MLVDHHSGHYTMLSSRLCRIHSAFPADEGSLHPDSELAISLDQFTIGFGFGPSYEGSNKKNLCFSTGACGVQDTTDSDQPSHPLLLMS